MPTAPLGAVTVAKSLDPELDGSAVAAVERWHWTPGTQDGHAVATPASVDISFRLKSASQAPSTIASQSGAALTDQRIIDLSKTLRQDELSRVIATAPRISLDLTPALRIG